MRIVKLDRRHTGYGEFTHLVDFARNQTGCREFVERREWCWDTWGPSCEIELRNKVDVENPAWCWQFSEWNTRLYFTSDKEANWFKLTWGTK